VSEQPTRRERYEQAQKRRGTVIATASTIIVLGTVIVLVPLTPGWEKVERAFFDLDNFVD
jgi:polar amino acid transport system permease protein